jgi:flagellar secretion chaperone FliS
MGAMFRMQAIRQYQHSSIDSAMPAASPHQLIAMLLEGALDRIAQARGAARNGDRALRLKNVNAAIGIVEYLNLSLERGAGPIAERLASIYDFCLRRLAQANGADDARMLDEVADVLRPIKQAWDEMPRPTAVQ